LVVLEPGDREAILDQAGRESPNECCGVLIGHGAVVERVVPTANALSSPVAFKVEPRELLDVLLGAESEGLDVVGYYHSHPASPAYPSPTDVRYAASWPGAVHLIVSLIDPVPSVRAFSIEMIGLKASSALDGLPSGSGEAGKTDPVIRELEVVTR
jgi:proteasome lid subunit RPN8/RPN11